MKHLRTAALLLLSIFPTSGCSLLRPKPPLYTTVELEGGLLVQDLAVPDEGPRAEPGDVVTIHYTITRAADGGVADSSLDRGQPFSFRLEPGAVFPGLARGLIGTRLLGRRRLFVPSAMGFGAEGAPEIPPHADLWVELELMELERDSGQQER